jgi:hypothetical protein
VTDPEAVGCETEVEFMVAYGAEVDDAEAPSEASTEEIELTVDEALKVAEVDPEDEDATVTESLVEVGKTIVGNVSRSE